MKSGRMALCALVLSSLVACEEDLFDVDLRLVLADAVDVDLDDNDVSALFDIITEDGDSAGGSERVQRLALPKSERVRAAVRVVRDAGNQLTLEGGGASPLLTAPRSGTLTVPLLIAPLGRAGLLSPVPSALGPDACVTDDGLGHVFLSGGSASAQGAYVLDDSFAVRGLAAGYPTGVGGVGCGAFKGFMFVTGNDTSVACNPGAAIRVVGLDGSTGGRREFTVTNDGSINGCGAAALARTEGGDAYWFIDGNNVIFDGFGDRLLEIGNAFGTGARTAVEVTGKSGLVVVVGGVLTYVDVSNNRITNLGPVRAVGRRGEEVLALSDNTISVVEDATLVTARTGIQNTDVRHFVMLDDDTAVFLRQSGAQLDVVPTSGSARAIGMDGVSGATRVSAIPGGTLVIAGYNGPGVQVLSLLQ